MLRLADKGGNKMDFKVDIEEYSKQLREELINTPHSVRLEAIIPPIDLDEKRMEIMPYTVMTSNDGCNAVTVAMLLYSLRIYINSQLEDADIKLAYEIVKSMIDKTERASFTTMKGDSDDK